MTVINDFRGEYGFLSNFYSSPFEYKGLVYPNSQAAFQAQKCATEEAKIKYTEVKNTVKSLLMFIDWLNKTNCKYLLQNMSFCNISS